MTTVMQSLKSTAALAMSALMGAGIVLGAVTMLGASAPVRPAISTPDVLVGISRFNTTDIRVKPAPRPIGR